MTYPQQPWQQPEPPQYPPIPLQQPPASADQRAFALNEIKQGRGHRLAGRSFSRHMSRVWIYAGALAFMLLLCPALAVFAAIRFHDGDRSEAWWIIMICVTALLQIASAVVASFARRNPVLYSALGTGIAASALLLLLTVVIMSFTRSGSSIEGLSWVAAPVTLMFSFGLVERIANPLRVPGYTANW